jgi:hypothetical protein
MKFKITTIAFGFDIATIMRSLLYDSCPQSLLAKRVVPRVPAALHGGKLEYDGLITILRES